jgi:hypothetical protein
MDEGEQEGRGVRREVDDNSAKHRMKEGEECKSATE